MDPTGLAIFAAALFVGAATPGPGLAAIVARVLAPGPHGAFAFTAGVAFGDLVWLGLAVWGLAALAQTFHWTVLAVKWAGIAYLLWIAWKMWTAPPHLAPTAAPEAERPLALAAAGLAVTLGNPKVMVFYLALLPTLIDLTRVTLLGWLELSAIAAAVLGTVFSAYVLLALRARAFMQSPAGMRRANRGAALAMAGAAGWAASR